MRNHTLNSIELHFTADRRGPRLEQCAVSGLMGRSGDDLQCWSRDTASANQFVTFAIIQVVVDDQQLVTLRGQSLMGGRNARDNRHSVSRKEFPAYLCGKDCVVFDV